MARTLRLNTENELSLAELAEAKGTSKQQAAVRAIRETARRREHQVKVTHASAVAREQYAALLHRLGTYEQQERQ